MKRYIGTAALLLTLILSVVGCGSDSGPTSRSLDDSHGSIQVVISDDKQSIIATQDGAVIWTANVIQQLGEPAVGSPEIRCIEVIEGEVHITFGKHSFAKANLETGALQYLGSD